MSLAFLVAVLGASFAGSAHCGAMCGGFVSFAAGAGLGQVGYHLGRLVTYALLGAIAGAVGSGVDRAGGSLGLTGGATVIAGALMIAYGVHALLRAYGVGVPAPHVRLPFSRWLARAAMRLETTPRGVRAFALGLSTTLIPCGWLYAFVIAAGGTQSPTLGAGLMAVFWVGTIPMLAGLAALMRSIWRPLELYRPKISAIAIVLIGLLSLAGRLPSSPEIDKEQVCHGRRTTDL